jgi:hypothetical protein
MSEDQVIDGAAEFAGGWDDAPEDTGAGGVNPEVWVLSEVTSAEVVASKHGFPQIKTKSRIIRSGTKDGLSASGATTDFLSMPPKGTAGIPEWKVEKTQSLFKRAVVCYIAPEYFGCKDEQKQARDAEIRARAGGMAFASTAAAMVGKRALQKLTVNDGRDKDGNVTYAPRAEKPINEIGNYLPATDAYMKYLEKEA